MTSLYMGYIYLRYAFHKQLSMCYISPLWMCSELQWVPLQPTLVWFKASVWNCVVKRKWSRHRSSLWLGASGTLWKHTFYRWIIAHKPCRWQQHTWFNWIIINILVVCSSMNMYDSTSWGLKDVTHTYSLQRHTTRFRSSMMTSCNGNIFLGHWLFVRGIHRLPVNSPDT